MPALDNISFLPQLVLRSPYFSYADYDPENIIGIVSDPAFRQAIYFASPAFYRVLAKKQFDTAEMNEKELLTLSKYYNRMCFRPTPFGNFSSIALSEWGDEQQITLTEESQFHLRPDQEVATLLGKQFCMKDEKFHCNPTLYKLGREFRYVKSFRGSNGTRLQFSLESVEANLLTSGITSFTGSFPRNKAELIEKIIEISDCTSEEATITLQALIDAQVLRSGFDCNISGQDYMERRFSGNQDEKDLVAVLTSRLASSAPDILPSLLAQEKVIRKLLNDNGHEAPEKVFYCNTGRESTSGCLHESHQKELRNALTCLQKLLPPTRSIPLNNFINTFIQRFEGRKIPLLQALDPDHGPGYDGSGDASPVSPLLSDIPFRPLEEPLNDMQWSASHQLFLKKWLSEPKTSQPLVFTPGDIDALPTTESSALPTSFSIMFRITEEKLLIEYAGCPSATTLIGRFTPFSPGICALGRQIAKNDQDKNPGVIFAEIGQLSDDHTDNVNRRESLYDYEIPVNSISLLDRDHQIEPSDLVVSVMHGEVILESTRLGKRVIPKLSSAYNFQLNQLPLFRFLCDLQYQSIQGNLTLDLEQFFPGMNYYPRVEFGDTILSVAKWHIKPEEMKAVNPEYLRRFFTEKKIPSVIALSHTDQQLVFNIDNDADCDLFIKITRTQEQFSIREFFLPSTTSPKVALQNKKPLIGQFIAFVVNNDNVYKDHLQQSPGTLNATKDFVIGSGWLYLKIYVRPGAANQVLLKKILPVIKDLNKVKPCTWFFVRYADPKPHIRLRIRVGETNTGPVIALFKKNLAGLVKDCIVREYQADTYRQELHRYGSDIMEDVEDFFHASSYLVCRFLCSQGTDEFNHHFAISTMSAMLRMSLKSIADELVFLNAVKDGFSHEYGSDKSLRIALDQKYRQMRKDFTEMNDDFSYFKKMKLAAPYRLFSNSFYRLLKKSARFDTDRKYKLLADLIHMHLNRIFGDRQREQEFVLYHCFVKLKQSETYASIKHLQIAAGNPG